MTISSKAQLSALTGFLDNVFVSRMRNDVKAIYHAAVTGSGEKGSYRPDRSTVSDKDIEGHLLGTRPIGLYVMTPEKDGFVTAAVVDLDDKAHKYTWLDLMGEALAIGAELEKEGLLPWYVRSGSGHGIHIWLFWNDYQGSAAVRRALAACVLSAGALAHIDIFPAQDRLNGGMGNLVALPFSRASRAVGFGGICIENMDDWGIVEPGVSRDVAVLAIDELEKDAGKGIGDDAKDFGAIQPELLASALKHLDASDYEIWMRVTLAIKVAVSRGEIDEENGKKVWDEWSSTGGDTYKPRDNDIAWQNNFKQRDGGVTLGTIFYKAKENGWVAPAIVKLDTPKLAGLSGIDDGIIVPVLLSPEASKRKSRDTSFKNGVKRFDEMLRWMGDFKDDHVRSINEDHFMAFDGGKLFIFREKYDASLERWSLEKRSVKDFKDSNRDRILIGHRKIGMGAKATQIPVEKSLADLWLESPYRRRYEEVVFQPSGCAPWQYNLWQGWETEPSPNGSWKKFSDHMYVNICKRDPVAYEYIINWFACTAQNLDDPIGTALVFRGNKGTGKSFFIKKLGKLFGQNYLHVTSSKSVTGNFNSHLRDCVLLFADEALCSNRPEDEAKLKGLITERELIIEGKGQNSIPCRNMIHLVMATNNDWSVSASADERRFFCLNVGDERQLDQAYFDAIEDELDNGGSARLLWDLLHRDISKFVPGNIPRTDELAEQKINAMQPSEKWWFHRISEGSVHSRTDKWERSAIASDLYSDYVEFCVHMRDKDINTLGSVRALSKSVCKMIGVREMASITGYGPSAFGENKESLNRTKWKLPSLDDCRKSFDSWLKVEMKWQNLSETLKEEIKAKNDLTEETLDF